MIEVHKVAVRSAAIAMHLGCIGVYTLLLASRTGQHTQVVVGGALEATAALPSGSH